MLRKIRSHIINFINSKDITIGLLFISAVASGLYPLLHYFNSNFTQVNSWIQFVFLLGNFILLPCFLFYILYLSFSKISFLKKYGKYVVSILNYMCFIILVIVSTYGLKQNILILGLVMAFVLGILFYKHVRKIIVFQFLLGILVSTKLLPDLYRYSVYSDEWTEQPDDIEGALFKKKPNVYIIQPDGYANFSELKKSNYNFDNSSFEQFLTQNDFKLYNGNRSNYWSTLSSNSSLFSMKHHLFCNPKWGFNELYNSRSIIAGNNPVISIFNNNDYKTFLILENSYLLVNRPEVFYDYCNFNYDELPYLDRGFGIDKNVKEDVKRAIHNNRGTNNFYFIEKMLPGHITSSSSNSKGKDEERLEYLSNLKDANQWLEKLINIIIKNDTNCLIVVVADHGGFVGLNSTLESLEKQENKDLVYSIFTSALAIKWPNGVPQFDDKLRSNVNLFRVLISYLSDEESYLSNLQDDKSYTIIREGAPFGVYELINDEGDVVFNKVLN